MKNPKKIPEFQISFLPENFIFCAGSIKQKRKFLLDDQDFFTQILRRYQFIFAFVNLPLYFLGFKKGNEFFYVQPLSLFIHLKNYFSTKTFINRNPKAKNVTCTTSPDPSPLLLSSTTEKIELQIQSDSLQYHDSSLDFPPVPSLSIFPFYPGSFDKEKLKSGKDWSTIAFSADKVEPFYYTRKKKELSLRNVSFFSKPRLNTEELSFTYTKNDNLVKSILNRHEQEWIESKDKYLNNQIPIIQLRPLNWEIDAKVIDQDFVSSKFRISKFPNGGSIALRPKYQMDFPSLTYSYPNLPKIVPESIIEEGVGQPEQSSNLARSPSFSNKIGVIGSESATETELQNVANRVYSLIEERIRRERELRGY